MLPTSTSRRYLSAYGASRRCVSAVVIIVVAAAVVVVVGTAAASSAAAAASFFAPFRGGFEELVEDFDLVVQVAPDSQPFAPCSPAEQQ